MKKITILVFLFFSLISITSLTLTAQHFDYHLEESPAVSWNGVHMFDARMNALGGISLMASEPFATAINPAFISIPSDSKILLGAGYQWMKQEAFQYWGINQGVIPINDPLSDDHFHLSGISGTFAVKGIRFSAGWYLANLLQFPSFNYGEVYEFEQIYSYSGLFSGKENTFFAAAAIKLGKAVDIGIKFDYISGKREVTTSSFSSYYYYIDNNWVRKDIDIRQEESHKLNIVVPTVGIRLQVSPNWTVGTALVYPLDGEAERTVIRSFINSTDGIEIIDTQNSTDTLHRPVKIYFGTTFKIPIKVNEDSSYARRFIIGAESQYTFWDGYKYIFFEEEIPREMRNTMVLAFGLEYGSISTKRDFFLRMGFRRDPQPVSEPDTALNVFSGGIGLRFGKITGDFGFSYYSGSPGGVKQKHFILNSTLSLRW